MVKKIILWSFYLLFVGGLIWAAINRSSVTLGDGQNSQNHGENNNAEIVPVTVTLSATAEIVEEHNTSERGWIILQAEVSQLNKRNVAFHLEDGNTITLNPRPWRLALEQNFQAALGDSVLLTGFYENDKFQIVHLRNLDNASVAQIRDEEGHPLWNSNGNGG